MTRTKHRLLGNHTMALLAHHLSVWEIAHRWAGYDPSGLPRLRLPLAVRDNCRILIDAIHHGELSSTSLQMEKWSEADGEDMKPYFIRHHMREIWDCAAGKSYSRDLLRWASIDRWDMKSWCEGHSIPLPEFWFPPTWGLHFDWTQSEREVEATPDPPIEDAGGTEVLRAPARTRIACQEISRAIWKDSPGMTIADMVKHEAIRKLGGGAHYSDDALRGWLSAVAPADVKAKRGRPRKKNPDPT